MPKALKYILSPLVLLVILALPSFYGCGGGETTTTTPAWVTIPVEQLTQQQLQQMLADSIDKYEKLNTYKFNIGMDISTNVTGGLNPWTSLLNSTMSGGTNIGDEQTKMTLNMTIAMTGMGQDNQEQSLSYDIYAMPDWLYMNMSISGLGEQWLKVKMSSSLKDLLNLDAVDQQMQPLESPTKIEYLRTEQVDGVECYVLSVSPSSVQLAEWLKGQNVNTGKTDWENLVNNTDVFKNVSLLYYVAKDSNLMMRMVMNMTIELSAAEAGASSTEFDNMSMILITDMKLSDHNQPFSVTLPDEASSATEVSEDIFKN
jgi:hypothetical protein